MTTEDDAAYKEARNHVRTRLKFYRNLASFVVVVGVLAVLDALTGEGWWVQWVAGIWGAILVLDALKTFVLNSMLGKDSEERMIQEELRRRSKA